MLYLILSNKLKRVPKSNTLHLQRLYNNKVNMLTGRCNVVCLNQILRDIYCTSKLHFWFHLLLTALKRISSLLHLMFLQVSSLQVRRLQDLEYCSLNTETLLALLLSTCSRLTWFVKKFTRCFSSDGVSAFTLRDVTRSYFTLHLM